jgi:hypothetical protein
MEKIYRFWRDKLYFKQDDRPWHIPRSQEAIKKALQDIDPDFVICSTLRNMVETLSVCEQLKVPSLVLSLTCPYIRTEDCPWMPVQVFNEEILI